MRATLFLSLSLYACVALAEEAPAPKPKEYDIQAKLDPAAVAPNASAKYVLTIAPKAGYKFKVETPFQATLAPSGDLKLAKTAFTSKDFDDPKTDAKSISTTVTAGAAAQQQITADVTFFICSDELCQRFKEKLSLPVVVK
jgi:hypothetical protein